MARTKGARTRKANPGNTNRRFGVMEREQLKKEVQRLDLHGYSKAAIAERLGVSGGTITNLVDEVNEDYKQAYVDDRKRWVMKATAAHLDVIRECQEQIARLKAEGRKRKTTKDGTKGDMSYDETAETTEDADVGGYLSLITENWTRIARLHGLEELPKQVFNVQVNQNTVNVFDSLLQALLAPPPQGAIVDATPTVSTP